MTRCPILLGRQDFGMTKIKIDFFASLFEKKWVGMELIKNYLLIIFTERSYFISVSSSRRNNFVFRAGIISLSLVDVLTPTTQEKKNTYHQPQPSISVPTRCQQTFFVLFCCMSTQLELLYTKYLFGNYTKTEKAPPCRISLVWR